MLLRKFDKEYTAILSNLISEQNSQLPGESDEDFEERMRYKEKDQLKKWHEQEPENYPDPAEVEAKKRESIRRFDATVEDLNNKVKNLPTLKTQEIEDIITTFDDNDSASVLTNYKIKAAQELVKRDDVDEKFLEDVIFSTDPNYVNMGAIKRIFFIKDPEHRISEKVRNGEYSIEKLKGFINFMVDKENYALFDSNSGQNGWIDALVAAMRASGKYFTGRWPNETWAK